MVGWSWFLREDAIIALHLLAVCNSYAQLGCACCAFKHKAYILCIY